MLKFARNKLITVHRKDSDTLMVHGVLEDDIYGLEVDAEVHIPDLTFLKVAGKWNRHTTPECPRSLIYIHEAEGLPMDGDIEQKLQKTVGRKGCRHFATLLIECCRVVRETMILLDWESARKARPGLTLAEFMDDTPRPRIEAAPRPAQERVAKVDKTPSKTAPEPLPEPVPRPSSSGFVVDLHTHTFPASPCGNDSVDEVVQEAQRIGLAGICLTDHNFTWSADQVEALRQKHGFLILRGNEVTTDQGHMVVFGLEENPGGNGLVKLEELSRRVRNAGGFLIVSHPFRGFLTFGVDELGLTVEKACERPLFKLVDGMEVLNGMVTQEENRFAQRVCHHLGLPATGGSDAHSFSKVGCYATQFNTPIHNETELVSALKTGDYEPVLFRQGSGGS